MIEEPVASPVMQEGRTRTYGRSAAQLTVAVGAAGALVYVFFAIASHVLDREDYGRIVVLWTAMFLAVSVLFRPVELLLARTIAENRVTRRSHASAFRVSAQIQVALALAFLMVALVLKGYLEEHAFGGESIYFWSLIGSVVGFAAAYAVRGYLAGNGRFGVYALLLLVDSVTRATFALVVAVGITEGPTLFALGVAIPPGLSAIVAVMALSRAPDTAPNEDEDIEHTAAFTLVEGGGFAASVVVVMVAEQVFLNSGPLLALGIDGSAAAGFIFNILMLIRAPVLLFQATTTSLLPHLTAIEAARAPGHAGAFRAALRPTFAGIFSFTLVVAGAVIVAGPDLMQLAFGDKFEYDRLGLLIVTAGMGIYLVASTLNVAALARGHQRGAAACWALAALLLAGWFAFADLETDRLVEIGVAGGAAVLCLLLALISRSDE